MTAHPSHLFVRIDMGGRYPSSIIFFPFHGCTCSIPELSSYPNKSSFHQLRCATIIHLIERIAREDANLRAPYFFLEQNSLGFIAWNTICKACSGRMFLENSTEKVSFQVNFVQMSITIELQCRKLTCVENFCRPSARRNSTSCIQRSSLLVGKG